MVDLLNVRSDAKELAAHGPELVPTVLAAIPSITAFVEASHLANCLRRDDDIRERLPRESERWCEYGNGLVKIPPDNMTGRSRNRLPHKTFRSRRQPRDSDRPLQGTGEAYDIWYGHR